MPGCGGMMAKTPRSRASHPQMAQPGLGWHVPGRLWAAGPREAGSGGTGMRCPRVDE